MFKHVYVLLIWESGTLAPITHTFTNKATAIDVARYYRSREETTAIGLQQFICNSKIGWNSPGCYIEF